MPTIFFDFDSTVCTKESLDEVISLALNEAPNKAQLVEKVEMITNQGMNGELDFTDSVRARFNVCVLNLAHFETVGEKLKNDITPGMEALFLWLSKNQWSIYIVSGGFRPSVLPTAKALGLNEKEVFTNDLDVDESGEVLGVDEASFLWTNEGKTPVIKHLKKLRNLPEPFVLVGDGSNDLAAFRAGVVDEFIGFGGNVVRERVKTQAPHFALDTDGIRKVLESINF